MTVEKSVVALWERTPGCETDDSVREFAKALARKRERFAFPNGFAELVEGFREYVKQKHNRNSEDGRFLRELQEIRVQATPHWDAEEITLLFWFIREDTSDFNDEQWSKFCDKCLEMISPQEKFHHISGMVAALADLTARDYTESDQLDLDYLSATGKRE